MFYIFLGFKRDPIALLLSFVANVVAKMKGNPRYTDEQSQVLKVETALQECQVAEAAASDRSRTAIQLRQEKRKALETEITVLAKLMELHITEDITFFTEAGFQVHKKPVKHTGALARPVLKYLRQGVLSGSLDGESEHFPRSVKQIGVEYSSDGGSTWNNGTYSTGKRFTLEGLTPRAEYPVRICYLGTRQRLSDWSEPMNLFVL